MALLLLQLSASMRRQPQRALIAAAVRCSNAVEVPWGPGVRQRWHCPRSPARSPRPAATRRAPLAAAAGATATQTLDCVTVLQVQDICMRACSAALGVFSSDIPLSLMQAGWEMAARSGSPGHAPTHIAGEQAPDCSPHLCRFLAPADPCMQCSLPIVTYGVYFACVPAGVGSRWEHPKIGASLCRARLPMADAMVRILHASIQCCNSWKPSDADMLACRGMRRGHCNVLLQRDVRSGNTRSRQQVRQNPMLMLPAVTVVGLLNAVRFACIQLPAAASGQAHGPALSA